MYFEVAGEHHLIFYLNDHVSEENPQKIRAFSSHLETLFQGSIRESVFAYHSLLIEYDYHKLNHTKATELATQALKTFNNTTTSVEGKLHQIPVCYDPSLGPDLISLAKSKRTTTDDIIQQHAQTTYQVFAIGFSPAFAYLGSLTPSLTSPRHDVPRLHIPAGSVGIAENQTAIYPIDSAAGWQILGQTPLDLTLKTPSNLTRFRIGDKVKFHPISIKQFHHFRQHQNVQ